MKYKNIILVALLTILNFYLSAQEDNVNFDDVQVIKEFSAKIGDFNKVNIEPKLPIFDLSTRRYKYNVRAIPVKLEYEKPKIRPLALPDPKPIHINKYYVKLGYGYPKFLDAELSIGYKKNNINSNIALTHLSANSTANIKDQRNSKTQINFAFFNRKNETDLEYSINGKIEGDYYYLYANNKTIQDSFTTLQNKRRILRGSINAKLKKEELLSNLDNKTELAYGFIQLNTGKILENIFTVENLSEYSLNQYASVNIPLTLKTILGSDIFKVQAKPFFRYNTRLLNIKIGGDIGKTQDLNFLYPYAEVSSNLFDNFIEIFASADNQIFNNTIYIQSEINPFMNFEKNSISTTAYNNYTAGIRSSLEGVKIEFITAYKKFKNKLFFIPSLTDRRTFSIIYDNGKNIQLQLNLLYKILPELEIEGNITNNIYTMDNIAKPWHTPSLTANFSTKTELINKKLLIKGGLFFASQSWFMDFDGNKKKLSSYFDLSAKASYKFLEKSSIFIEVNNIFSQKYQKWYQYPNYGINGLAGMEIRF